MRETEYPSARELANDEERERARACGVTMGFEGVFLDAFVSNELGMAQKKRHRKVKERVFAIARATARSGKDKA